MILIIEINTSVGKYKNYKLWLANDTGIILSDQLCLKFQVIESFETPIFAEVDFLNYEDHLEQNWFQIGPDNYLQKDGVIVPDQLKKAECIYPFKLTYTGIIRGFFGISEIRTVDDVFEYRAKAEG